MSEHTHQSASDSASSNESSKTARIQKGLRTIAGGMTVMVGIVAIPYPGPGWLIVFAGLAILAKDYPAAQRILDALRARYEHWQSWLKRQNPVVKTLTALATVGVVVLTIYLLNGYGIVNDWLHLKQDWLRSPLPLFK